jgi:hypothetical protein
MTALFAIALLAVVAVVVTQMTSSSSDHAASSDHPRAQPATAQATARAAARSRPACAIVPAASRLVWNGPALTNFVGVAVPGSGKAAGSEVCEVEANGIRYHLDISPVALRVPAGQIAGTKRVMFGSDVAYVNLQNGLESWLFEGQGYSGQVFFQTIGLPTASLPSVPDTERLIRLLVDTASRRNS